jgi:hypothetical protein
MPLVTLKIPEAMRDALKRTAQRRKRKLYEHVAVVIRQGIAAEADAHRSATTNATTGSR